MVEITISENKNYDPVKFFNNRVRVFVNQDFEKGVWIDEDVLFKILPKTQKKKYLTDRGPNSRSFKVGPKIARRVVKMGYSSKGKPKVGNGHKPEPAVAETTRQEVEG